MSVISLFFRNFTVFVSDNTQYTKISFSNISEKEKQVEISYISHTENYRPNDLKKSQAPLPTLPPAPITIIFGNGLPVLL